MSRSLSVVGLFALLACQDTRLVEVPVAVGEKPCVPVVGEPELDLELVATGLDNPVQVVVPPGDLRLFVVEQKKARIVVVDGGEIRREAFLDLDIDMGAGMEQGLVSLAFHPGYRDNRRFFISYTRASDRALVVEEWKASEDLSRAEGKTKTLFELPQETIYHHSGRIGFGPDGLFYMGRGDGGPQGDPNGHVQDMGTLFGKFIRIDVDREEDGLPYGIPPGNPFVGQDEVRPEIYALGVRNPWGWSIDAATGHLYFGDVSQNTREEISVIPAGRAGGNYGWPVMTGDECSAAGCDSTPYVAPLTAYEWATAEYCATMGGQVYRGCRMPGYHGRYFYTDFCAGFLRSFVYNGLDEAAALVTDHEGIEGLLYQTSGIGLDAGGELIMIDREDGALHRVVPRAE